MNIARRNFFYKKAIFLLFIILFLAISDHTQADEGELDVKITQNEKAVLSFFRMAGVAPDYESWISANPRYQAIENPKEKQKFLIAESLRLGQGYSFYNPSKSVLEFNTNVIARYNTPTETTDPIFHFKFPDQTEDFIPVFEFPYGNNSIALVINKFAEFSNVTMSKEEFGIISKIMPYSDEEYTAKISMHVRVVRADIDKPIISQDVYQWMMLGEIAVIKCKIIDPTNFRETKLWEYVSPWYEDEYREKTRPAEKIYPHPYDLFKDKK